MSYIVYLFSFANKEFTTSSEQNCSVFPFDMLENVSHHSSLWENVEAEVVIVPSEAVNIFVFFRVEFLWWCNILIFEDLTRLIVVLLNLILNLDPADAQTDVGSNEWNGFINPPNNSHYMFIILTNNLSIVLNLSIHRRKSSLLLCD